MTDQRFAQNLKAARERAGMSQQDVADKQAYLKSLGFTAYDTIYVCPQPHDEAKAKLVQDLPPFFIADGTPAEVRANAVVQQAYLGEDHGAA